MNEFNLNFAHIIYTDFKQSNQSAINQTEEKFKVFVCLVCLQFLKYI